MDYFLKKRYMNTLSVCDSISCKKYIFGQKNEVRLRLGIKNERTHFVVLSAYTNFDKKTKLGCALAIKKSKLFLYSSQLALTLDIKIMIKDVDTKI